MSGAGQDQTSDVIDFDVLDEIRELMEENYSDLVRRFLIDTADLLEQLAQSLEQGNAALVHRAAHTLKSSAAALGAVGLSHCARQLEIQGRVGALQTAETTLRTACREFALVKQVLEDTLEGQS
jgi:HPt (histidine-containing phosphotransfer) domain-containing protein